MKKHIINLLLIMFFLYFLFTFVIWELNPSLWTLDARFELAWIFVCAVILYLFVALTSKN